MTEVKKGWLLLEDETLWPGFSFGAETTQTGECVFHTAHTGYQEILTDPSYQKQILVFSAVQIGNQGFHEDDFESSKIWASGCIVRDYSEAPTHWRKEKTLDTVLKEQSCPGLFGVDTRRLILHLRENGNLWGVISTEHSTPRRLSSYLKKHQSMMGLPLTHEVTTPHIYEWQEGSKHLIHSPVMSQGGGKKCVVMDFGVKRQILRYCIDAGFKEVMVVPAHTSAQDIRALKPDALLLSNGPGDPAAEKSIIEAVKKMIGEFPILGICLGHQILGLALGLQTFKLKFGHHGANHPVKNLKTGEVQITSQNHGFAVDLKGDHDAIEMTHLNLNDQTVEGFVHKTLPVCGIQFHPESGPGPLDSTHVFQQFFEGRFL